MEPGILQLNGWKNYAIYLLFEFMGTLMLLFGIMMSTPSSPYLGVIFLFIAICLFGRYTGGYFNGAISLAVFLFNIEKWRQNLLTLILTNLAEWLGAYFGVLLAYIFIGTGMSYSHPADTSTVVSVVALEAIASYFMITFIMYCKTS